MPKAPAAPRRGAVRRCKDCRAEGLPLTRNAPYVGPRCASHDRRYRTTSSDNRKDALLLERYGITGEDYQKLLQAQGGRCFICRKKPGRKRLSVDHDHKKCTDHPPSKGCKRCVRGLLHSKCNSYLGWVGDDPSAGNRLSEYLTNPPARAVFGN